MLALEQLRTALFLLQQRVIVLEKLVSDLYTEIKNLESRNADDV